MEYNHLFFFFIAVHYRIITARIGQKGWFPLQKKVNMIIRVYSICRFYHLKSFHESARKMAIPADKVLQDCSILLQIYIFSPKHYNFESHRRSYKNDHNIYFA